MRDGAALSPHADPSWRPGRNRVALALTVGAHLLAIAWLQQRRAPPMPADAPRVVTFLLQLPRARPAPVPAPAVREAPWHAAPLPRRPAVGAPERPAPRRQAPSRPLAPTPAPPAADPLAAPQPAPADATARARDPAAAAGGSFSLNLAKREAGRIDRELRGGKSGVPLEADTPWARFQRGIEAAHVERSLSAVEDSYTSPDGVVIYRHRVGNRVMCYRTGGVGLGVAGAVGVNDAGSIQCPSGVTWQREH